jgi:AraC-like DNA-binding protein
MGSDGIVAHDRVIERRRSVALACHFREIEGLSIAQIADRLGRSPATIKAYFYDPTGEKARAVKARYVGVCRGCGAYTQPRNGKGDGYAYCKACHPGAIERRWSRARVTKAMRSWGVRYGWLPTSHDWSRTHAQRRGGEALARLAQGEWPAASVVTRLFGTWSAARAVAAPRAGEMTRGAGVVSSSFARESISLPKPRESTAISEVLRGGEPKPEPVDLQVLRTTPQNFAHNSGR